MKRKAALKIVPAAPAPAVLTPEVKADRKLEMLIQSANYDIKYGQESLNQWRADFEKNPAHAFEWSAKAFVEAAQVDAAKMVLHYVEALSTGDEYSVKTSAQILAILQRDFQAQVLREARSVSRSTSPTSNEMSLCKNAAMARMLERLLGRSW